MLHDEEALANVRLRRMTRSLQHRGPDGEGWVVRPAGSSGGVIGLGHCRLAVLDLSDAGKQPMVNPDGTCWIVFNGEIYNFWELRRRLESQGEIFESRCDTEVLLRLLSREHESALGELNGMWAFAFWDERSHRLLLSRDRIGIKPLYYYHRGSVFIFGSEIKSLLAAGVPRSIRDTSIAEYLRYGYIPDPLTFFDGIRQLEAGTFLVYEHGTIRVSRYWNLCSFLEKQVERTPEALRGQLDRSVRLRMLSDVPVGAFLSGGIDSSAIVASMAATSNDEIRTFCISFQEATFDEAPQARLMASTVGASHFQRTFEPDGIGIIEKVVQFVDEPFADDAFLPTYAMCQMARSEVTVALSGDGGDELFAGYHKYQTEQVAKHLGRHTHWAIAMLASAAGAATILPIPGTLRDRLSWFKHLLDTARLSPEARYISKLTILAPDLARELCRFQISNAEDHVSTLLREPAAEDFIACMFYADVRFSLLNQMLRKVDRMSMACSLEVRVPFLDHNLVEFAAALPSRQRIHRLRGKYLLREAIRPRLPAQLMRRKKQGFDLPLNRWFRGGLIPFVREILSGGALAHHGLLDRSTIERMLTAHESGKQDLSRQIFALLTFQLWYDAYMRDRAYAPPSDQILPRSDESAPT